jgi:hypothetical protein
MADLNALAADLIEAKEAKEAAEDALKAANAVVEAADAALFAAMVDAGLSKIAANGFTFSPDVKDYYRVPAANMDEFHELMIEMDRGGIFKVTANAQTINATIRELVGFAEELPEPLQGVVEVYQKPKCNMRKATARA